MTNRFVYGAMVKYKGVRAKAEPRFLRLESLRTSEKSVHLLKSQTRSCLFFAFFFSRFRLKMDRASAYPEPHLKTFQCWQDDIVCVFEQRSVIVLWCFLCCRYANQRKFLTFLIKATIKTKIDLIRPTEKVSIMHHPVKSLLIL